MITQKTVLILGAGASMPYGFQSGPELLAEIVEGEPGNWRMSRPLCECGFQANHVERFLNALSRSGIRSIDRFLGLRTEFADVGKAAIILKIGLREATANLYSASTSAGQWYELILDRLHAPVATWRDNRLSIITLNYDRSIEQFFLTALQHSFGINLDEALEMFSTIPVVHPHGSLGSLDPCAPNYRPFGGVNEPRLVAPALPDILVLHERETDSEEFRQARKLINEAALVFVLGFSYEQSTVERLGFTNISESVRAYGTARGLERIELEEASARCGAKMSLWNVDFDIRRFLRGGPTAIR